MDRYFTIITLLSFVCQVFCQQGGSTRVIGGQQTTIEEYPYVVQVFEVGAFVCGGTLVSTRCVLTAASCVASATNTLPDPNNIIVRVGTAQLNSSGTEHSVVSIELHPNLNMNTWDSDLAILVLTRNVILGPQVSPLSASPTDAPDNANVTLLGWGPIQLDVATPSAVLRKGQAVTIARAQCSTLYTQAAQQQVEITDNMFCAGLYTGGTGAACSSDQGGPVLLDSLLAGVVSRAELCGVLLPGVHVRVHNYSAWIESMVKKHNSGHALGGLSAAVLILSLLATLNLYS